jgi:SAM-dependent methyltransferase
MEASQEVILGWDVVNWSRAIQFWEARLPADLSGMRSLEIGSDRDGLALWLAQKNCDVLCSDLADPRPKAYALHLDWGVTDRIRYESIDATNIPYENEFDIVIFKSVLGGIGWEDHMEKIQEAMREMHKALKPGGRLLFAENLDSVFHRFFRRRFLSYGKAWRYVTQEETLNLLSPFTKVEYDSTGFLGAFGRSEQQRRLLGRIDQLFLSKLVGRRNHYIMYCVATK